MTVFWLSVLGLILFGWCFALGPLLGYAIEPSSTQQQGRRHRRSRRILLLVFVLGIPMAAFLLYFHWGSSVELHQWYQTQANLQQAKQSLTPDKMQTILRARVARQADDQQAWYLLGRVYLLQQQTVPAIEAFQRAYELNAKDVKNLSYYIYALYQHNGQQVNPLINSLIEKCLQLDPNNKTALAILANAAK